MDTKEKILEALEDEKEFELVWTDEITYSKIIRAKDEKEAREIFDNGDFEFDDTDITDTSYCEYSLEIIEQD